MFRKGLLVVISGPSGAGKGTLLKLVCEKNCNIVMSISATTRKPRNGEVEGINYFYKTQEEFGHMIENNEFLEWVEYCGNFYGTPKKYIEECTSKGQDVILEIETDGAVNIKNKFPDCASIFITPPSFDELKKRIITRGTEEIEVIEKRMQASKREIKLIQKYDYVIVNDNLQNAALEISSILISEKLRIERNNELVENIKNGGEF